MTHHQKDDLMHRVVRLLPMLPILFMGIGSAPMPASAQSRSSTASPVPGPGGSDPALFRAPPLDPMSFVMAYHRLTGTSIDFRPHAEQSTAYRNATAFDRQAVLTREIARLEGQFASLDLNKVYLIRVGTALQQYDGARQGYEVAFNPEAFIVINDPVTYRSFGLQFRNLDEVTFLPVGDTSAARNFAQRYGLSTQYDRAGDVALEVAVRLAEAPPAIATGTTIVRADIVAARITRQNQVIWDFGTTAAGKAAPSAGNPAGTPPVLKAADIMGIHVGMPFAEATGIASRTYPLARLNGEIAARYFQTIEREINGSMVRCGLDGVDPSDASQESVLSGGGGPNAPAAVSDVSEACVGLDAGMGGANNRTPTGRLSRVTSGQRLPGTSVEALRTALQGKFGQPTYTLHEGRTLQWVGRDPTRSDSSAVVVVARILDRRGAGTILGMEIKEYVDPSPRTAPTPAAAAAPRL